MLNDELMRPGRRGPRILRSMLATQGISNLEALASRFPDTKIGAPEGNRRLSGIVEDLLAGDGRSWSLGAIPAELAVFFQLERIVPPDLPPPRLWLGTPGSSVPIHRDRGDLLNIQLLGRKAWWLAAPEAEDILGGTDAHKSGVAISALNSKVAAKLLLAQGKREVWEFVLGPGDALLLPSDWWHSVQSLDQTLSISTPTTLLSRNLEA